EAARARYLLGRSLEAQGRGKEAARLFRELRLSAPGSGYDDAARDHLERLLRAGITLPPLTASERLDRAERLLAAGMASAARDEAEMLLAEGTNPETALRALRVVAGAWRRLGRYDSAARSIERALAQAPVERRPGLLLELARFQERAGSWKPALGTAERLLREVPAAREAPLALLLTARIFEENGKLGEAATAYDRLAMEFPGDEAAGAALWRLGWLAYLRGDLPAAARRFGGLALLPAAQRYRLPAAYWAGRAREKLGEHEEARRLYLAVIKEAPRSYYGLLAAHRAKGVRIDPGNSAAAPLPVDPLAPLAGDPRVARVAALRALGLAHFAATELEQLLQRSLDDLPRLYGVSAVYVKNEQYHLALRILRRYFAELAESGSPAIPRAFWEMFYPIGWQGELREAAQRAGLDPNLVAAVVREESSFFPLARSRVGARGLMQLMPDTARAMGIGQDELLDHPEANLRMGTTFLAGLVKKFGDPRLAAAAYNAGAARVR
ncbi:MAG: transglycosylase SLT domain-containing protein, partial [candidate division NC10 bacterium]